MATLSLTVADVRQLDHGGGVGHGNLPVTAGNSFWWRPVIIGKIQPASFGLFLCLFSPYLYLFSPDTISFCTLLQPLRIFSGRCQENVSSMSALFAVSFRRRLISQTDGNRIQKY